MKKYRIVPTTIGMTGGVYYHIERRVMFLGWSWWKGFGDSHLEKEMAEKCLAELNSIDNLEEA